MAVAVHGTEPPALGVAPGGVTSAAVATVAEHTAASTTAARQNVIGMVAALPTRAAVIRPTYRG